MKQVAPHGSWRSVVSAAAVAEAASRPGDLVVDGLDIYIAESRPEESGRVAVVQLGTRPEDAARDVLTAPYSARSRVHEYGGGTFNVRAGNLVFAAGQIASDFATGVAAEARVDPAFPYYGSEIKKQTRYILDNLKRTFTAAGSSLDHVVKAQVFLTDLNDFSAFDEVWKEYFKNPPPRTTVGTSGLLVEGCRVEIDLIGVVPS